MSGKNMRNFSFFPVFIIFSLFYLTRSAELAIDIEYSKEADDGNEENWQDNPEVELPEGIEVCKRYDPNRDECIKKSLQDVIALFKNGYPKLNIPSYDPLTVKRAHFDYQRNQLQANLNVKNVKVYGMSSAQIKNVQSNVSDTELSIQIDVHFNKVTMEGYYKGEGRYNDYRVKSKGYFNMTFSNVLVPWKMTAQIEKRNEEEYMVIKSVDVYPSIESLKFYATGIFPDPITNQLALDFINEYWSYYYHRVLPDTRKSWEPILVDAVNQIFERIPFRRLMPL